MSSLPELQGRRRRKGRAKPRPLVTFPCSHGRHLRESHPPATTSHNAEMFACRSVWQRCGTLARRTAFKLPRDGLQRRPMSSMPGGSGENIVYAVLCGGAFVGAVSYAVNTVSTDSARFNDRINEIKARPKQEWTPKPWPPRGDEEGSAEEAGEEVAAEIDAADGVSDVVSESLVEGDRVADEVADEVAAEVAAAEEKEEETVAQQVVEESAGAAEEQVAPEDPQSNG
ncbi:uncharacterized protein mgarpa isoform X2 [Stigmatopora nigra]